MDIEAVEREFDRLRKELERLKPSDPDYKPISENMERLSRIIGESDKRDLERVNANVSNDVKEDGVRVDMEKVKTDRLKAWLGFATAVLGIGASAGLSFFSYNEENIKFKMPFRDMFQTAKNLVSRIR